MENKKSKEIVIEVDHISKKFKSQEILRDVSISFEKGKTYGLVGENGSGKTVLLKMLCGLIYPDSGSVVVDQKILGKQIDFPDNMGIIIEAPGFLSSYSGLKNLMYLASLRRKISKQQIEETMRLVGLDPKDKKHVGKYSLGMKQKLGIAQVIMENPDILILDEPMNGLDKKSVVCVRELLLQLKKQEKTIILASHIQKDIEILCDEVFEVDEQSVNRIL